MARHLRSPWAYTVAEIIGAALVVLACAHVLLSVLLVVGRFYA
jgi:hypothetical protein